MPLLRDGQVIRDTYEVDRFLGAGAFAEVYRVKHRFLGNQALKVFKTPGLTRKETEDALQEAVLLSRIGHPNIIRVFDANTIEAPNGTYGFFTMEYVPGGSLDAYWQSYGMAFVPVETSVEIIRQACRGLSVAHGEKPPIIHRDIKPQNLLIGYDAGGLRVRVSDFGLAKRVNPLTLQASARGTRAFKAPEALIDFQCDSPAGDVWALGVTLYLLLTDHLPRIDLPARSHPAEAPPVVTIAPPGNMNILVDGVLSAIVMRALAPDPRSRYSDALGLLRELDAWNPGRDSGAPTHEEPLGSETGKAALGIRAQTDATAARLRAQEALNLARRPGGLSEAADLLEQAINESPALRQEYEYQLRLWRRGITM